MKPAKFENGQRVYWVRREVMPVLRVVEFERAMRRDSEGNDCIVSEDGGALRWRAPQAHLYADLKAAEAEVQALRESDDLRPVDAPQGHTLPVADAVYNLIVTDAMLLQWARGTIRYERREYWGSDMHAKLAACQFDYLTLPDGRKVSRSGLQHALAAVDLADRLR